MAAHSNVRHILTMHPRLLQAAARARQDEQASLTRLTSAHLPPCRILFEEILALFGYPVAGNPTQYIIREGVSAREGSIGVI